MNGKANPSRARKVAELECAARDESLAADEVQEGTRGRVSVRVTSVRKRLIDEDNLISKYHTDLCRYAGMLLSDAPGTTSIKTTQRKAVKGEEEHVMIEITDSE